MLLRAVVTKGEQVRYISHLDFARTVERALRRAKLPVAYSEGFNPHVKLAFASALSVGVTGEREYFDVELKEEIQPSVFVQKLAAALPAGITAAQAVAISDRHKALMAVINYATYTAELPYAGEEALATAAVAKFNGASTVPYTRISPKGKREIDFKRYITSPVAVSVTEHKLLLSFGIAITPGGSAKASEFLEVLTEQFSLPVQRELALIRRDGLWVKQGNELVSPLELRE